MYVEREQDVLRAASMYYLQDLKMEVIARHLGTSRSTVSRLLKRARETGLVEITLRPESVRPSGLGRAVAAAFDVETYVVPVPDTAGAAERLEHVAMTAARLLGSWCAPGTVLGVAGGAALAAVARHLAPRPARGAAVVPLHGAAGACHPAAGHATDLAPTFASAFGAAVHHLAVPAFFDDPGTRAAMWRERSVRRVLDVRRRADVAVFSVGGVAAVGAPHAGYLDEADVRRLHDEGVVGEVCTLLLRADGSWRDVPLNERASGPTPDELRRVPRRVCVVAGDDQVAPLLAALRARLVTDLVVDEVTAGALADAAGVRAHR